MQPCRLTGQSFLTFPGCRCSEVVPKNFKMTPLIECRMVSEWLGTGSRGVLAFRSGLGNGVRCDYALLLPPCQNERLDALDKRI